MPVFASENVLYKGNALALSREVAPKVDKHYSGYVYVVKMSARLVKIGRSADPVERMKSINRSVAGAPNLSPRMLYLSPACFNYKEVEACLLSDFAQYQTAGEYFNVPVSVVVSALNDFELAIGRTPEEQRQFDLDRKQATQDIYGLFNALSGRKVVPPEV
ncbi:GIY-YIG nuclease family protein [Thalassospira mesophila]|uniref:Bacteriophage T5 Orf172 DNA-binding domain-containing protein n=1 Tax=Thalassospira mesophila TaxID=1293891 RepID=A0A1Y2L198_9PROT|nr:GIY-YIG nuclease family protein [Thalassospira mesophila]OSQ39001.1 hypothetical protein TMES_09910 [Thalassospira mesophila]